MKRQEEGRQAGKAGQTKNKSDPINTNERLDERNDVFGSDSESIVVMKR